MLNHGHVSVHIPFYEVSMCQNNTYAKNSLLTKKNQEQTKKKYTESQYNKVLKYKEIDILDVIKINTKICQL